MKVEPLSFYELMRTSHVKRWTIINTIKEQNLAEHQYNVTVIGLGLHKRITDSEPSAAFIAALMFHDAAEIRYGDVPTPGKVFMKDFMEDANMFGSMDSCIMPRTPYITTDLTTLGISNIIKLADLIEAAWWIHENGAGHHAKTVADKCWRAVEEFVHAHNMYDAANPILADLGLPFINKSERLTPP